MRSLGGKDVSRLLLFHALGDYKRKWTQDATRVQCQEEYPAHMTRTDTKIGHSSFD